MDKIKTAIQDGSWLELVIPTLINLGIAIAIFVIGSWIIGRLVGLLSKVMEARKIDAALRLFLSAILRTLLKFVIALVAIEQMGIDTTSLLALLGAAGLAVGLALKDSLSNFASGVMLIIMKPFDIGDFIEAAGVMGSVEKITVFNTIIISGDNKEIVVPNGHLYADTITNYSARATRRVDVTIGIGYGDDIKKARDLMQGLIDADERVLKTPEPIIQVDSLSDHAVNFVVRPWVKTDDLIDVKREVTRAVKIRFDEEGIIIPFPQRDLHVHMVKSNKASKQSQTEQTDKE